MKTSVSSVLLLSVLVNGIASALRASGADTTPLAAVAGRPPSLRKGKVLILKNEYTIEGDIERVGDRYCVRRKVGETWVPAERVLALVASLPDAYAYLRSRINCDDPDERLRLARWCRTNGLPQQALTELRAAAELRPSHVETRRLLRYWQQASAQRTGSDSDGGAAVANPSTSFQKPADPPPIEVTTESLGLFATRVQPILMNTCARCHATGKGGKFQLTQVFADGLSNRRTLERNLAAVLAEINVNQPEASQLLIKAVSDHAHTGQAPLRDRQAAPYRTLENWVKRTVADNPHLREKSVPVQNVGTREATQSMGTEDGAKAETPRPRFGEAPAKARGESQWGTEARPHAASSSSPAARPDKGTAMPAPANGGSEASVDPYDPEPFNRKMHPEANK
jgi:hypothetical protein